MGDCTLKRINMGDNNYRIANNTTVSLPAKDAETLFALGDGDCALLYLFVLFSLSFIKNSFPVKELWQLHSIYDVKSSVNALCVIVLTEIHGKPVADRAFRLRSITFFLVFFCGQLHFVRKVIKPVHIYCYIISCDSKPIARLKVLQNNSRRKHV